MKEYFSIEDIAKMFKVTKSTVHRWMNEGMPSCVVGKRTRRFDPVEVDAWIRRGK